MSAPLVLRSEAVAVARQTIGVHSKSFALAARLFPRELRDEASVVYTYCRRVDDAIDLAGPGECAAALERLQGELEAVYRGDVVADPALAAFGEVARRRGIPRAYPQALLDGMAMDAAGTRYRTLEDLLLYAYRVASTVGLMMSHVMGVRDAGALQQAAHLGLAMQLTNICRDVAEDWQRGRLYLPAELLERYGAGWLVGRELEGEPLPPEAGPALAACVAELGQLTRGFYRSGDRGLGALPWRAGLAVRAARLIYSDIDRVIARRGHDVLAGRAVVSKPRKLLLAGWALVRHAALLPAALFRPFQPAALHATPPLGFADVAR